MKAVDDHRAKEKLLYDHMILVSTGNRIKER
jgi:hypothetical protein